MAGAETRAEADSNPSLDASRWWPIIRRHLPVDPNDDLADRRGRAIEAEILRLLRGLTVSGLTALEFPLAEPTLGLPDISQRAETPAQAYALARRLRSSRGRALLQAWAGARESAAAESELTSEARDAEALLARIPSWWLEFDLRRRAEPEPLFCIRLPPNCGPLPPWVDAAFAPRGPDDGWREALERCRRALPEGSRPLYLFDLGARRPGSWRLEIFGIPALSLAEYLARIGFPPPSHLASMAECMAIGDRPHLSFDISSQGNFSNRLGIEVSFPRLPSREPRWRKLFEALIGAGLCLPRHAESFFAWQGQDRRSTEELWPPDPELAQGHFARAASHVKVVLDGQKAPKAKGYLLFQYLPAEQRRSNRGV